jgi:hypothetical protein
MLQSEMHFEQVPLEMVKKITEGREAEKPAPAKNKHQQGSKDMRQQSEGEM